MTPKTVRLALDGEWHQLKKKLMLRRLRIAGLLRGKAGRLTAQSVTLVAATTYDCSTDFKLKHCQYVSRVETVAHNQLPSLVGSGSLLTGPH